MTQSNPAGRSSSRMRALVIMPRSPTSTTRDGAKPEQPAQARTGGSGDELARGGELGGRRDQPPGDQPDCQRRQALVARPTEQAVEADRADITPSTAAA